VLNVRERVEHLLDPGTFIESGLFGASPAEPDRSPADGKVAGFGRIDGRDCAVVANDFTVMGASSAATNGRKIGHMKRVATSRGLPIVFLGESSGARMPDHMGARGMATLLGNDGTQYVRLRETPWAAATLGLSYGSSSWYSVLSDFNVVRKGAVLAVSSAQLASLAIKENVDPEEMGGWEVHSEVTGFADAVAETDEEALDLIRAFLSYLPSHHNEAPPERPVPAGSGAAMADIAKLLPAKRTQVYDVRKIVRAIVDDGSFFELKAKFGKVLSTGLARLNGRTVGILANNPLFRLREGRVVPGAVRQLQHSRGAAGRHAGLLDRRRGRTQARAGQDHELHAGAAALHRAEALGDPAQDLWPGLSQHGRRAELRRGGGVADRRGELHGPDLRGEDRARARARTARLRRGLRADEQGQRAVGRRGGLCRPVDHPAAGNARLSDPHARHPSRAADGRHRPAPHARVAHQLLGDENMATIQVKAEVSGSVWQITTKVGQKIEAGDTLMIIESMKMEIPVIAEHAGTIDKFMVDEKAAISEGQVVAVLSR
jgi:biotin carboxyl carrier protein